MNTKFDPSHYIHEISEMLKHGYGSSVQFNRQMNERHPELLESYAAALDKLSNEEENLLIASEDFFSTLGNIESLSEDDKQCIVKYEEEYTKYMKIQYVMYHVNVARKRCSLFNS